MAIARRYAKALLLIAKEDGHAEDYREELNAVSSLFDGESNLSRVVTNPLYETAGRRIVLERILNKLNLSKVLLSFLMLLFDKGRMGFLADINTHYLKLADELKGIARAELISSSALSTESVEKIRKSLSAMTGKEIVLAMTQDPSLIGGVITKIGDLVLDGSVRTQLASMRESLKRGEQI